MNTIYWISGAVSLFIFAYLVVALLKPEIF